MAGFRWRLLLLVGILVAASDEEEAQGSMEEMEGGGEDPGFEDGMQVEHLAADQLRMLHGKFDGDKDGKVSMQEIVEYERLVRAKIARADVIPMLEEMDADKDGKISLEEYVRHGALDEKDHDDLDEAAARSLRSRKLMEEKKFKAADRNNNGLLEMEEFPAMFYPEMDKDVLELAAQATHEEKDKNADGRVSVGEFWEYENEEEAAASLTDMERADFARLDANNDGSIDVQEMKAWESGQAQTEEIMQELYAAVDKDKDGFISAAEMGDPEEVPTEIHNHFREWFEAEEADRQRKKEEL